LPVLDRLDLLDHGVPLLNKPSGGVSAANEDEVRQELRQSIERS